MGEKYPRVDLPRVRDRYSSVCFLEVAHKFVGFVSVVGDNRGAVLNSESSMETFSGKHGVDVAEIERSFIVVIRLRRIGTVARRKVIKVVSDVGIDEPSKRERLTWLSEREVRKGARDQGCYKGDPFVPFCEPRSARRGSYHDAGGLVRRSGVFTDS
jgi:hypothetical protein